MSSISLAHPCLGYELRADELTPLSPPQGEGAPLLLAGKDEIKTSYSIPSAFSAYLIL